jgi:hypothetical protein
MKEKLKISIKKKGQIQKLFFPPHWLIQYVNIYIFAIHFFKNFVQFVSYV